MEIVSDWSEHVPEYQRRKLTFHIEDWHNFLPVGELWTHWFGFVEAANQFIGNSFRWFRWVLSPEKFNFLAGIALESNRFDVNGFRIEETQKWFVRTDVAV